MNCTNGSLYILQHYAILLHSITCNLMQKCFAEYKLINLLYSLMKTSLLYSNLYSTRVLSNSNSPDSTDIFSEDGKSVMSCTQVHWKKPMAFLNNLDTHANWLTFHIFSPKVFTNFQTKSTPTHCKLSLEGHINTNRQTLIYTLQWMWYV